MHGTNLGRNSPSYKNYVGYFHHLLWPHINYSLIRTWSGLHLWPPFLGALSLANCHWTWPIYATCNLPICMFSANSKNDWNNFRRWFITWCHFHLRSQRDSFCNRASPSRSIPHHTITVQPCPTLGETSVLYRRCHQPPKKSLVHHDLELAQR